jgi:putative ABC transport system ATP-binding protein
MVTTSDQLGGRTALSIAAAATVDAVKVYGEGDTAVRALDDVTVMFEEGRFAAIMGPSGSGKSTLLHCTAGLDSLTAGKAFIGDTDLSTLGDTELTVLRRQHVGFVFQAFNLVPTLTAEENITLPLALAGRKGDLMWIREVTETLGLSTRVHHRPSELSGASSSAWQWRERWPPGLRSSSLTSRQATSTRGRERRCCGSCAKPWTISPRRSSW